MRSHKLSGGRSQAGYRFRELATVVDTWARQELSLERGDVRTRRNRRRASPTEGRRRSEACC